MQTGPTITLPDVSQEPIVIWAAIILIILVFAATASPKILGPFGTAIREWAEGRRRAGQAKDDFRVVDLAKQLGYAQSEVSKARRLAHERYVQIHHMRTSSQTHVAWDWRTYDKILQIDPAWPPPPLMFEAEVPLAEEREEPPGEPG